MTLIGLKFKSAQHGLVTIVAVHPGELDVVDAQGNTPHYRAGFSVERNNMIDLEYAIKNSPMRVRADEKEFILSVKRDSKYGVISCACWNIGATPKRPGQHLLLSSFSRDNWLLHLEQGEQK